MDFWPEGQEFVSTMIIWRWPFAVVTLKRSAPVVEGWVRVSYREFSNELGGVCDLTCPLEIFWLICQQVLQDVKVDLRVQVSIPRQNPLIAQGEK